MILGVYGYPDSGKTSMVEKLITTLSKDGFRVASVKHSAHGDLGETEGKDSWRHAEAGSDPVALMTPEGTVVRIRCAIGIEEVVEMIGSAFRPDVILIEGLKEGPYPKVSLGEIRPRKGTVLSNPTHKELHAYITRGVAVERALASLPRLDCGKCGLKDCISMAEAIADGKRPVNDCKELASVDVSVTIGDRKLAMGNFVSDIVDTTVRGMLSSLRGYEPGTDVEIRLKAKSGGPKRSQSKRR